MQKLTRVRFGGVGILRCRALRLKSEYQILSVRGLGVGYRDSIFLFLTELGPGVGALGFLLLDLVGQLKLSYSGGQALYKLSQIREKFSQNGIRDQYIMKIPFWDEQNRN